MPLLDFLKTLTGAQGETTRTSSSGGGGGGGSEATGDPHYGKVLALIDAANTTTTYTTFDRNFIDVSTNSHTMSLDTGGTGVRASSLNPYFPPEGYNSVYYSPSNIKWQTVPHDTSFKFGSGDFTLECFVNITAFTRYGVFASDYNGTNDPNGAGTFFFRINDTTNQWQFQIGAGSGFSQAINSSTDLTVNTWHHIAVTRSGTSIQLWQDGVEVGSGTSSVDFNNTQTLYIGSATTVHQYTGYISNFRIVKGTAVYTSAFTTPTSPLTDITGTGLLCCQSKRYVDRSSNAHTVSPSSQDPLINSYYPSSFQLDEGNDPTKYGGSYLLDSSTNYQFKTPGSAAFNYGTGDFTWEGWIRPNSLGTSYWLDHGSNAAMVQFYNGYIKYYPGASIGTLYSTGFGSTDQISLGAWHHLAVSRVSGTTYLFLDGKLKNSAADTTNLASNYVVTIGEYGGNIYPFDGYMADLRITKGAGLYTADFDLPTQKLTATSQTSLLLQPDLGIVEKTGKHSQFHNYGTLSVDNYSQHLHYASYFDGLGDYLSIADDASLELGSSSFTLEMWYKGTDTDQYATLTATTVANFSVGHWSLMMNHTNTGDIAFYFGDYSVSGPLLITTTPSVVDNRWHHIALVRNGNSWVLYIDGISRATATSSAASTDDSGGLYIGYDARYGRDLSGYITDFRLVKGTAVYTSAFTPPNVPLTAISGTSLLISTDQATVQDSSTNSHTVTVNGTVSSTKEYNSKETKTFDIDAAIDFNTNDYIKLGWGKGYIDGDSSGTYQNTSDNNIFHNNGQIYNLQDKDFTIEFWFKRDAVTDATYADAILCNAVGIRGIGIAVNPTGYTGISYQNTVTSSSLWTKVGADPGNTFGNIQIELGKWYHYAVVRDGSNGYQYVNGIKAETFTFTGSLTDWNGGVFLGHWHDGYTRLFNGQIAQLRFTKGVARYTDSVFNVPTTKFPEKYGSASSGSGTTLATDAYFANTVFLQSANTLPANTSVNNNETILDKSTNSLTVTLNGNTKVQPFNPYTPVGEWSIDYSQGNSYTYWTNPSAAIPPQIAWLDGASDSGTFETWVYMTETQASGSNANAAAVSMFQVGLVYIQFSILSTGAVRYYWFTGSQNWIDTTTTLKTHQWHHVALTRDGTDLKIYIDGVLARSHSSYTGISWGSASNGQILYHGFGGNNSEKVYFKGYMSNMRSSDNVRYTGTFDVPTEKFTSDANTLYLSHDNNKRKSRDTNGYQLVDGVAYASTYVRVVSFSPYDSSVPYQNEVGCIEFDGTGDSIDIEAGNHFVTDFGSSDDVTWEGWVYLRASQNSQLWGNTGTTSQVLIHVTSYLYAFGFQGTARSFATELYEWHHIAAVRSSGTVYIYVDGVLHDSGAGTGVHNNTSTMRIGERADGYNDMNGLVADVHWMQGYAKYTSAFTPPASPVSIHSNTVTKLPFNDLSFYDATENSSLESSSTTGSAAWPWGRHIKYASYHPDSTTGNYTVAETASNEFTFGTGDVTMELFYLPIANPTNQPFSTAVMIGSSGTTDQNGVLISQYGNTGVGLLVGGGSWAININVSSVLVLGRWHHVAYSREGNVHRLYVNGDLVYSTTNSVSVTNPDNKLFVGGRTTGSYNQYLNGYVGDVRVVKGTAVYTDATITPPFSSLTAITNTVYLQSTDSTTLVDTSASPLTITQQAGIGSYTNFKTTLQVATTPLSFDGASYINIEDADNIIGKFGTQDFTIEAYVWRHAAGIYGSWLASDHSGFNSGAIFFRFGSSSANPSSDNNGKFHVGWHGVGDSFIQTTNTYADRTWHHYALVRSGNSFTQYVNGLRDGTATSSAEFNLDVSNGIRLGQSTWDTTNGYFNGMISQLRITVGNARYSGGGFVIPDNYFPAKKP